MPTLSAPRPSLISPRATPAVARPSSTIASQQVVSRPHPDADKLQRRALVVALSAGAGGSSKSASLPAVPALSISASTGDGASAGAVGSLNNRSTISTADTIPSGVSVDKLRGVSGDARPRNAMFSRPKARKR
jgi:hypothetical protein